MDPRVEKILKMPLYQRILILLVISCLIVTGYYYMYHMPATEDLQRKNSQNQKLLVKLQENRRIANNLPRFKAEYEKMQVQLKLALKELPNASEIPSLLSSVAGLARDNGLEVIEFKPLAEVPQGFYAKVPVQLKLNGGYHEMAFFCQAVSDLDRIVNVENMKLGSASSDDGTNILSISSNVITYRFVENPPGPPKQGKRK